MTVAIGKPQAPKSKGIGRFFRRRKRASDDAAPKNKRMRILVWAVLISLGCTLIGLNEPFEELAYGGRDIVRAHNADGQIVVVGKDDRTVQELGGTYFPRRYDAQAIDNLFKLGAKRVFFDMFYQDATTDYDDALLNATLKRHKGKVFFGFGWVFNSADTKNLKYRGPNKKFQNSVSTVNLAMSSSPIYAYIPFSSVKNIGDKPSLSSAMAQTDFRRPDVYRPDWSIRSDSIPTVSFLDVARGNVSPSSIAGKDVLIGATTTAYNDHHLVISQKGFIAGLYGHVIGAETLKRGNPISYGWIPGFIVGLCTAALFLFARQRKTAFQAVAAAAFLLGIAPIFLDSQLITVDVVPGAALFIITAIRGWSARRVVESTQINSVSGLPNLAALQGLHDLRPSTLIALKIRNYAAIAASFDDSVERTLVTEILRRINLNAHNSVVFHADDTLFWFTDMEMGAALSNHLEGLNAISGAAMLIGNRMVDVQIAFGIDGDFERPLTSRIGSASLCAQEAARNNEIWKFYDPERQHEAAWQLSLIGQLERAIANGELWIAYQPKLDLKKNCITGAEALVRWQHPERGTINPDEFVIAAETHNRIDKLTAFVLDRALADASTLRTTNPKFSIAVNLSAQLLESSSLLLMVQSCLRKHNFPPENLVLEITETAHLARSSTALKHMADLRLMGIHLSVDDYGTGNATMDYLKLLPTDEVKIDRSFVAGIVENESDRIMVQSTISLVHALGRKVVAEGVETRDVLEQLRELNCDMVQGYLISKPGSIGDLARQLPQSSQRVAS